MDRSAKDWSSGAPAASKIKVDDEEECETCDTLEVLASLKKQQAGEQQQKEKKNKKKGTSATGYWEMRAPPDKDEVGTATWTLLHTMAAYYPTNPSDTKKHEMNDFLQSLSRVYPCSYCAKDFQVYLQRHPPLLSTQQDFALWLCKAHNAVNVKTGKPEFDCTKVDQRWKAEL